MDHLTTYKFTTFATTPRNELFEMYTQRRKTFVDHLAWDLPIVGSALEVDQFDHGRAVYVQARKEGHTHFSARLLTRADSMVAELWPGMLEHVRPDAIEISRLCVHDKVDSDHRWNRKVAPLLIPQIGPSFAIADCRIIRVYSVLGIKPTQIDKFGDIYLAQWA